MGTDLQDDYDVRPVRGVVAVEPAVVTPGRLALEGGRPNPFVANTALRFTLTRAGQASLSIIDIRGRLVRRIEFGTLAAGVHTRSWDGIDMAGISVPAGVYFAELVSDEGKASTRLVRMR
jgi:flagellar basal-body rod modification protein FlgD